VLPLSKKLGEKARPVWESMRRHFRCEYDDSGSIGKRYRRQDEIGTPFCVTVDFDSLEDEAVTVRDRDAMTQDRVGIDALERYLLEKIHLGRR
jgi:glycyl-tRNA synthetase